jgi:hypothetical protein
MESKLEFGRAFIFFTEDEDWVTKFVVAAALPLIPFLIFFVSGYQIAIIRNVMQDEE